jgi:ferredoxin
VFVKRALDEGRCIGCGVCEELRPDVLEVDADPAAG